MENFIYCTPTKLYFGKDSISNLVNILEPLGKRVLLTYGGGSIKKNGLYDKVKELFFKGEVSFNDEVYITNIRQKNLLQNSLDSLELVINSINDGMPEDFYSIDLMNAYQSLGLIIGESVEDDLVEEIFSKFCMGK